MAQNESRPPLRAGLSPQEFDRWYWLASELRAGAAEMGIPVGGRKDELAQRIRAALAGEVIPAPHRRRGVDGLTGALDVTTPVPAGQRLTRRLREFMIAQCGPSFRFTAEMRAFFAGDGERTLGDAIDLWMQTRDGPRKPSTITGQFEYNSFHRTWRAANPGGTHAEMVVAWRDHREKPRR